MAGAGLRLGELFAGEGELACPVPRRAAGQTAATRSTETAGLKARQYESETVGPVTSLQKYFATQRGEGQSKNPPGPFSCFGRDAEASNPPRMLTQWVGPCQ